MRNDNIKLDTVRFHLGSEHQAILCYSYPCYHVLAHENTPEKLDEMETFLSSRCGFSLLPLSLTFHSCSFVELTDDKEYRAGLICTRSKCVLRQDSTFECMMGYGLLKG